MKSYIVVERHRRTTGVRTQSTRDVMPDVSFHSVWEQNHHTSYILPRTSHTHAPRLAHPLHAAHHALLPPLLEVQPPSTVILFILGPSSDPTTFKTTIAMMWAPVSQKITNNSKAINKAMLHQQQGSWDVVTPNTSLEGNIAMEVAREADTARNGAQRIEERVSLTDTAIKLRVALFPEVRRHVEEGPGDRSPHRVLFLHFLRTKSKSVTAGRR